MILANQVRELATALADWERYESISKEQFLINRDTQNMVLHAMFLAIQTSIDAGAWLIASQKISRKPASYRETFEILADLASLRNVIVHQYSRKELFRTVY